MYRFKEVFFSDFLADERLIPFAVQETARVFEAWQEAESAASRLPVGEAEGSQYAVTASA